MTDIRIDQRDIRRLESASEELETTSRSNADRILQLGVLISNAESLADTVIQNLDRIERFFEIQRNSELSRTLRRTAEGTRGGLGGVRLGLEAFAVTRNPVVGLITGILAAAGGTALGATEEDRRVDQARVQQQLTNSAFMLEERLRRQREAQRDDFELREALKRRLRRGR